MFSGTQKGKRLQFCRRFEDFDWTWVMFSDECVVKLRRGGMTSKIFMRRRNGERRYLRFSILVNNIVMPGNLTVVFHSMVWVVGDFFGYHGQFTLHR